MTKICLQCGKIAELHYRWDVKHRDSKKEYIFCSILCIARWCKNELEYMCVNI